MSAVLSGDNHENGAATGPLVKVEAVRKSYGRNEVLSGIDLCVSRGEVIALIGASGSGKSTLLRCINGLEAVNAGRVEVLGVDLADPWTDTDRVRQRIGIVFQSFNLFPHLSVLSNITLAPIKTRGVPKANAEKKAMELLERLDLADKAREYPDRLSGGQQQRVAIVRALAMEPDVMLFDEVTSALDPELVGEVLTQIRELAHEGMTMLLATHEMGFARDVAHRVCFLKGGVIVEQGTPTQIFDTPTQAETQQFLFRITEAKRH
jgi:polar amino acid transport system ATP-binding protein